jgi:Tol biopolymer transport system component
MDADGSNQQRLTGNSAWDREPSWSSDGSRIAFISYRDGNYEIYVMDTDGSNQQRLSNNPAQDQSPSWSP